MHVSLRLNLRFLYASMQLAGEDCGCCCMAGYKFSMSVGNRTDDSIGIKVCSTYLIEFDAIIPSL